MGGFKDLYDFCQTLEPKVSRKHILKKTLEITGVEKVKEVIMTLDTEICRGMFVSATNKEHRIVQQLGCSVIIIARSQKYCWQRFVYTKELMHLFDNSEQAADTPVKLDAILADFEMPSGTDPVAESEYLGFWMALACLCPEKNRLEFKDAFEKKHTDYYSIALQLRIPEHYVPLLFQDRYRVIVDSLLN